jgi:hypothetical protein
MTYVCIECHGEQSLLIRVYIKAVSTDGEVRYIKAMKCYSCLVLGERRKAKKWL